MSPDELRDAVCTTVIRFLSENECGYNPDGSLTTVVQEFLDRFLSNCTTEPDDTWPRPDLQTSLDIEEIRLIEDALRRCNGNVAEAASELGLKSRAGLYKKMQRFNIRKPGERPAALNKRAPSHTG